MYNPETLDIVTDSYISILHQIILKLFPHNSILKCSLIKDISSKINTLMEFLSKELGARGKGKFTSYRKANDEQYLSKNSSKIKINSTDLGQLHLQIYSMALIQKKIKWFATFVVVLITEQRIATMQKVESRLNKSSLRKKGYYLKILPISK